MRVLGGNMNGQEERVNDEGEGMEGFSCRKGEGGRRSGRGVGGEGVILLTVEEGHAVLFTS